MVGEGVEDKIVNYSLNLGNYMEFLGFHNSK